MFENYENKFSSLRGCLSLTKSLYEDNFSPIFTFYPDNHLGKDRRVLAVLKAKINEKYSLLTCPVQRGDLSKNQNT